MVSLPGKSFRPETRIRKESRKITDQAAGIHLSEKKVEQEGIGVRMTINKGDGAPGEIRTPDPLLRRQTLYPPELRAPWCIDSKSFIAKMNMILSCLPSAAGTDSHDNVMDGHRWRLQHCRVLAVAFRVQALGSLEASWSSWNLSFHPITYTQTSQGK